MVGSGAAVYNEIDPFAAQWLRNLIQAGHIAPGDVDERSILDVSPDDWRGYGQVHAFAGIGIWSHALRRAGVSDYSSNRPIWTGSCPCQPFSQAGQGAGFDDERHLWPAWHWLIEQHRPHLIFGEQVASKAGLAWLDLVSADLEGAGYTFGATDQCVAGFGGPHIRQRLWFVAHRLQHASGDGWEQRRPEPVGRSLEPRRGPGGLCDAGRSGRGETWEVFAPDDNRRNGAGVLEGAEPASCGVPGGLSHDDDDARLALGSQQAVEPGTLRFKGSTFGANEPVRGFWSGADWIWFRDGKYRPVEEGTFPLAHGDPGRVGSLRAYGNAICAEVAAGFIEEAMHCIP